MCAAIVIAAALFAAGHLPFLFTIAAQPRPALVLAVLTGNFIPGLIFGWLFWRRGLEAAILSHSFAHCINALATGGLNQKAKRADVRFAYSLA